MKKCDEQVINRDEQARRGGNGGENESGFFRQEDRIGAERRTPARQRTDLRVRQMCSPGWATEAQRRKTAAGSPKGERSESIFRIYRNRLESIWPELFAPLGREAQLNFVNFVNFV